MKMAHFIPTTTDISTLDLMKLHIRHVWKLHGIPLVHGTDRGSMFTANFTRSIYKDLGISHDFLRRITRRLRVRSRITTSGWKRTFGCSALTGRMIGQICC
jgi:transposase InsO family protein